MQWNEYLFGWKAFWAQLKSELPNFCALSRFKDPHSYGFLGIGGQSHAESYMKHQCFIDFWWEEEKFGRRKFGKIGKKPWDPIPAQLFFLFLNEFRLQELLRNIESFNKPDWGFLVFFSVVLVSSLFLWGNSSVVCFFFGTLEDFSRCRNPSPSPRPEAPWAGRPRSFWRSCGGCLSRRRWLKGWKMLRPQGERGWNTKIPQAIYNIYIALLLAVHFCGRYLIFSKGLFLRWFFVFFWFGIGGFVKKVRAGDKTNLGYGRFLQQTCLVNFRIFPDWRTAFNNVAVLGEATWG